MTTIKSKVLAALSDGEWHYLPDITERIHVSQDQVRDFINRENSEVRNRFYCFIRRPYSKSEQFRMFKFSAVVCCDELEAELKPLIQKLKALKDTYNRPHPVAANLAAEFQTLLNKWMNRSNGNGNQTSLL